MAEVLIEFRPHRSPNMATAIELATRLGATAGSVYQVRQTITSIDADTRPMQQLYGVVGKWKGTGVSIVGLDVDGLPNLIRGIAAIRDCYSRRGGLGQMYCSTKDSAAGDSACFGCRHLAGLQRLPHARFDQYAWWQFGRLSDDLSRFAVDRPAVLAHLRSRGKQICTLCPAFSWAAVERDVSDLPGSLDLDDDSPFCVQYSQLDPLKATGVRVRAPYLNAPRWMTP